MDENELISWLTGGDVSIQYQVYRDLLEWDKPALQARIARQGWGLKFLSLQKPDGHWGLKFYQPKWTSTHYTLLDIKNLAIQHNIPRISAIINRILTQEKGPDGGINPSPTIKVSDVCINGLFLNYASYFRADEEQLKSIVDFILSQHMPDGGFNCRLNRSGAVHSSLHTTISVLEGILEYTRNGYTYKLDELKKAEKTAQEFILMHRLFKSDKTGEVIDKKMLVLAYPCRWRYDILRALDYFQSARVPYDERMQDALDIIIKKRNKDHTWNLGAYHPGQVHFKMEQAGHRSRWNTLRAMKVLKWFKVKS